MLAASSTRRRRASPGRPDAWRPATRVREPRRVFNPELLRARQAVGNLRGHHAAIVFESRRHRPAIEDRSEESAPIRLFCRRVGQHVEGRERQHLNVGSGVEPPHVRQQLGLVRRRQ